jgi:hypothetical protein
MQLRKLGQPLLRQSALHAQFAHALAKDCSWIGTSHPTVMLDCCPL